MFVHLFFDAFISLSVLLQCFPLPLWRKMGKSIWGPIELLEGCYGCLFLWRKWVSICVRVCVRAHLSASVFVCKWNR